MKFGSTDFLEFSIIDDYLTPEKLKDVIAGIFKHCILKEKFIKLKVPAPSCFSKSDKNFN